MKRTKASLEFDAHTDAGKHVTMHLYDCESEVKELIEVASQESITEEELDMFKAGADSLFRSARALAYWAKELETTDWIEDDSYN